MKILLNISLALFGGVMVCLLVLPIAVLITVTFTQNTDLNTNILTQALWLSAWTTALSTVVIFIGGTPLAWWLARSHWRGAKWLSILIELPIVLPPAVAGLALLLTFGRRGLLGGTLDDIGISIPFTTLAVIIVQVFVGAPFYIRSAQVGFASVDKELESAAQVDGADEFQVWWYITLPLASRALGAGLILAWARALGEFGATILLAGNLRGTTQTMPLLVYSAFESDLRLAIVTGCILVLVALSALILSRVLTNIRSIPFET
jgi:molybdate transport system permease protein